MTDTESTVPAPVRKRKLWDMDDQGATVAPPAPLPEDTAAAERVAELVRARGLTAAVPGANSSVTDISFTPGVMIRPAGAALEHSASAKLTARLMDEYLEEEKQDEESTATKSDTIAKIVNASRQRIWLHVRNVEINFSKHRYYLMRPAVQADLEAMCGVKVKSFGRYYPHRKFATLEEPPLYLRLTSESEDALDKAVHLLQRVMKIPYHSQASGLPLDTLVRSAGIALPTANGKSVSLASSLPEGVRVNTQGQYEQRCYLPIEPSRCYLARGRLLGPQGAFIRYLQSAGIDAQQQQQQMMAQQRNNVVVRVHVRGHGSGHQENGVAHPEENNLPLHLYIACTNLTDLLRVTQLAMDLVRTVIHGLDGASGVARLTPPGVLPAGWQSGKWDPSTLNLSVTLLEPDSNALLPPPPPPESAPPLPPSDPSQFAPPLPPSEQQPPPPPAVDYSAYYANDPNYAAYIAYGYTPEQAAYYCAYYNQQASQQASQQSHSYASASYSAPYSSYQDPLLQNVTAAPTSYRAVSPPPSLPGAQQQYR